MTASRSATAQGSEDTFHVPLDLSQPDSIEGAFEEVTQKLGSPPSVVVYNGKNHAIAYPWTCLNQSDDVSAAKREIHENGSFSLSVKAFTDALNINTVSLFAAAKAAHALKKDVTFIYTGNVLNRTVLPGFLTLGVGKSASAHIIQSLAAEYKVDGSR